MEGNTHTQSAEEDAPKQEGTDGSHVLVKGLEKLLSIDGWRHGPDVMEIKLDEFLLDDAGRPTGRKFSRSLCLAGSIVTIGSFWSQEMRTTIASLRIRLIEEEVKALRLT